VIATFQEFSVESRPVAPKTAVALGAFRYSEYCQFTGVLSILNSVFMETEEKTDTAYLTQDHAREFDDLNAKQHAIFMKHQEPFSDLDGGAVRYLPLLYVQVLLPITPDERAPRIARSTSPSNAGASPSSSAATAGRSWRDP